MGIYVSKFPYLFWFMNYKNSDFVIDFSKNKLFNSKNEEYEIQKIPSYLFLLIKYIPFLLIGLLLFNKYDFYLLNEIKILQFMMSLILAVVYFFANGKYAYISFFAFIVIFLAISFFKTNDFNSFFLSLENIPFAIKYFFMFIVVFNSFFDFRKSVYAIIKDNKVVSHFVLENYR